ncbi:MAG: hypothetical protein QMD85_01550 [Candidatus Aenigmarchaeota archaeon]|nr:hypothetical protein [Candidatus Aenigmarchaeota archaeon]
MFFKKKGGNPYRDVKDAMEEPTDYDEEIEKPVRSEIRTEVSAPLFVKIDKYRDIIGEIQELKSFVSNLKQTFTILHEIESIRSDTLKIMRASLQRLEKSVLEVDAELVRPKGISLETVQGKEEIVHIEGSLTDLQKQLNELKRELQDIR